MPSATASTFDPSDSMPMPLRPIRDEQEYARALREVEQFWESPAGSPEDDRLQVLVLLIEAYEREHHSILPPDPVDAIRFRMEQNNLTTPELATRLGVSPELLDDILQRKRALTLTIIRRLAERLGVSADVLIRRPAKSIAAGYDS